MMYSWPYEQDLKMTQDISHNWSLAYESIALHRSTCKIPGVIIQPITHAWAANYPNRVFDIESDIELRGRITVRKLAVEQVRMM